MKRYVLLGTVGAGKSTLYAALHGIACDEAKKTQAMQYDLDGGVDTPGEFFCHPMYYPAIARRRDSESLQPKIESFIKPYFSVRVGSTQSPCAGARSSLSLYKSK